MKKRKTLMGQVTVLDSDIKTLEDAVITEIAIDVEQ